MNKFKSITVFGCSFGDYLNGGVKRVYGDYLAELLALPYQHQSQGGGSNDRIWRRCWEMHSAGQLQDSLVIIQYTEPMRREFWAARGPYHSWRQPATRDLPPAFNEEPQFGGTVIRWKMGADQWQHTPGDQRFFRLYQHGYVGSAWAEHTQAWHHDLFQHWLAAQSLSVIFLRSRIWPDYPLIEPWQSQSYRDPFLELTDPKYRYEPDDTCHMNELGHQRLAQYLHQHIQNLGWA